MNYTDLLAGLSVGGSSLLAFLFVQVAGVRKALLCIASFLLFAGSAFSQESLADRISKLEANNASISASLARQQSDIADLKASVSAINDKLDAVLKSIPVVPSSLDWSGAQTWSVQPAGSWSSSSSMMMYSSSYGEGRAGLFSGGGGPVRRLLGKLRLCKR